jgi:hypothetical protein
LRDAPPSASKQAKIDLDDSVLNCGAWSASKLEIAFQTVIFAPMNNEKAMSQCAA